MHIKSRPAVMALRRRPRAKLGLAIAGFVLFGMAMPARPDVLLGTAVGVQPAAVAELGGQQVTIILGSQLFEGQTIVTSPVGEVQVVFVDDTRMVIGPNSMLVVERILMRNATTFSSLVTNALSGTFRFITGNSPHDAYTMNTPAGTISVRGTAYDLNIEPVTRRVDVVVYRGGVDLCPQVGRCVRLEERCEVGNLAENGAAIIRRERDRAEIAGVFFPYALFQGGLRNDFRVPGADDCTEEIAEAATAPDVPLTIPVVAEILPPPLPPVEPPPPPPPDPPPPPPHSDSSRSDSHSHSHSSRSHSHSDSDSSRSHSHSHSDSHSDSSSDSDSSRSHSDSDSSRSWSHSSSDSGSDSSSDSSRRSRSRS